MTGVQTCALPISDTDTDTAAAVASSGRGNGGALALTGFTALPLLGAMGLLVLAGAGIVRGAAGRFFPTV